MTDRDSNNPDDAQWSPYGDQTARIDQPPSDPASLAYSQGVRQPTARFDTQEQTAQYPYAPAGPPTGPSVTTTSPIKGSGSKGRSKGLIAACIAAGLVLIVVIGLVGSELFIRNRVTNCMQNAFSQVTGSPTKVSVSRKPMLLQAISDEIPFVQIDTDDNTSGMKLHARADGISTHDNGTTISSLTGSGDIPFQRVITLSQQAANSAGNSGTSGTTTDGAGTGLPAGTIQSITGNAADGTIDIESSVQLAFLPIPVSTTIKPTLEDGKVKFDVEKANAFVFGIPKDFAQQVVDQVSTSLFGPIFDEVKVKNLKVTDSGVDFAVDGTNVDLSKATAGQTSNTSCSLI